MRFLFLACAFVSSALLFVVEPMVAKMILPTFGGAPQVWNTALVFFQAVLLLGYLYAHQAARKLPTTTQRWVHLAVAAIAILTLPISIHTAWFTRIQTWVAADKPPIPLVLLALAGLIGLPFFALSANSSCLQRWYSMTGRPDSETPWFLYSAGNIGSMLALLAYPTFIEPMMTLTQQGQAWTGGYLVLLVLLAACALTASPSATKTTTEEPTPPTARKTKLLWLALAAVPSSLLLGITTYLTSNIAPIPLLWVIPLALYLLTFILVFAKQPKAPDLLLGRIYPMALAPLMLLIVLEATMPAIGLVHLAVFFVACWMCHSRLAHLKPDAKHLTEFYFYISLGGVLGGAFNALIAPVIFQTLAEYPLALVAAALLIPKASYPKLNWRFDLGYPVAIGAIMLALVFGARAAGMEAGPLRTFLTIGVPAILCFVAVDFPLRFGLSIGAGFLVAAATHVTSDGSIPLTARSFFGVHKIVTTDDGRFHNLINGNTIHGVEDMQHKDIPLTYYYPRGPMGEIMIFDHPKTAAFIGLGVGSLAAYGMPGQQFTYYEIDPIVEQIAENPQWFTFLKDSQAHVNVILGDARLEMAKSPAKYDLIVADAFSSDAIPVHLLTQEAIQMYLAHLNPNGLLVFHVSNRYLDFMPILGAEAHANHLYGFGILGATTPQERALGAQDSEWVLMCRNEVALQHVPINQWMELDPTTERPWTDDYSDVIAAFALDR